MLSEFGEWQGSLIAVMWLGGRGGGQLPSNQRVDAGQRTIGAWLQQEVCQ